MVRVTMTENNRNPSATTRLARSGPVIITEKGQPAFELRDIRQPASLIDGLVAAGVISPARSGSRAPLASSSMTRAEAVEMLEEFTSERSERDW